MNIKQRKITILIAAILILILLVGIVLTILESSKGKDDKSKKIKKDGTVVTLDDIPGKLDQHTLLLSASQSNNGCVDATSDYRQSNCWKVYYDGTVEYYVYYNLSGSTNTVTWELTDQQFEELVELLQGDFFKYDEDYESACDGDTWHYTYYGLDGETLHSYNGYNYSVPVLLDISEILDSDVRDQAEIVPVEKVDSHNIMVDVTYEGKADDQNSDEIISSHWTIYYDGWIESQDTYQIGGKQSIRTWQLDDYTYGRVVRSLMRCSIEDTNEEPMDGENCWALTYYDEAGNETYTTEATAARNNIFSDIYSVLQAPEEGFSYIEDPDAKVGCTTSYRVGDYSITIDSINPGHKDNASFFSTYFYWQDAEDSTTTIHMSYSFEEKSLKESRVLENLSTTTIDGKKYYYNVVRDDGWKDSLWLHYETSEDSYMMIILETTGVHDQDWNWIDETDADIEKILEDEIIKEAIRFEIIEATGN